MRKMAKGHKGFTIGELIIVFAIVGAMIFLSFPFLRHLLYRRDAITCTNNLRALGLALYIYAREHGGKFPRSLKSLYDEGYLSDKRLVDCPSTRETGILVVPDYIYAAGLTVKGPSHEKLVWDKAMNHAGGGKNVLYLNGTVAWQGEEER